MAAPPSSSDSRTINLIEGVLTAHADYTEGVRARMADRSLTSEEVDAIRRDDRCRIGIWLRDICHGQSNNHDYLAVCTEHTRFHNTVANIAELFIAGQRQAALDQIDAILSLTGGGFADILDTLTRFVSSIDAEVRRSF